MYGSSSRIPADVVITHMSYLYSSENFPGEELRKCFPNPDTFYNKFSDIANSPLISKYFRNYVFQVSFRCCTERTRVLFESFEPNITKGLSSREIKCKCDRKSDISENLRKVPSYFIKYVSYDSSTLEFLHKLNERFKSSTFWLEKSIALTLQTLIFFDESGNFECMLSFGFSNTSDFEIYPENKKQEYFKNIRNLVNGFKVKAIIYRKQSDYSACPFEKLINMIERPALVIEEVLENQNEDRRNDKQPGNAERLEQEAQIQPRFQVNIRVDPENEVNPYLKVFKPEFLNRCTFSFYKIKNNRSNDKNSKVCQGCLKFNPKYLKTCCFCKVLLDQN